MIPVPVLVYVPLAKVYGKILVQNVMQNMSHVQPPNDPFQPLLTEYVLAIAPIMFIGKKIPKEIVPVRLALWMKTDVPIAQGVNHEKNHLCHHLGFRKSVLFCMGG